MQRVHQFLWYNASVGVTPLYLPMVPSFSVRLIDMLFLFSKPLKSGSINYKIVIGIQRTHHCRWISLLFFLLSMWSMKLSMRFVTIHILSAMRFQVGHGINNASKVTYWHTRLKDKISKIITVKLWWFVFTFEGVIGAVLVLVIMTVILCTGKTKDNQPRSTQIDPAIIQKHQEK